MENICHNISIKAITYCDCHYTELSWHNISRNIRNLLELPPSTPFKLSANACFIYASYCLTSHSGDISIPIFIYISSVSLRPILIALVTSDCHRLEDMEKINLKFFVRLRYGIFEFYILLKNIHLIYYYNWFCFTSIFILINYSCINFTSVHLSKFLSHYQHRSWQYIDSIQTYILPLSESATVQFQLVFFL